MQTGAEMDEKSLMKIEAALLAEPTRMDLHARMAETLMQLNRPVPLEIQMNAIYHYLDQDPDRLDLWARLAEVLLELGKPVDKQLELKTLRHYLNIYDDRVDLYRKYISILLFFEKETSLDDVNRAFPEYPGAAEIFSFFQESFENAFRTGNYSHLDLPSRALYDLFPHCPYCVYYRAYFSFHFDDPFLALSILREHYNLVHAHDFLFRLYINALHFEGRAVKKDREADARDIARKEVNRFFGNYSGDLWRDSDFVHRQKQGIERRIPPILIATLPKSGSVFLLNTLSQGLRIPATYICPVGLYYDMLIDAWAEQFARGGAICVDHVLPTPGNLARLTEFGVNRVVLHYRDPRQSALSFVHHGVTEEVINEPRLSILDRKTRTTEGSRVFESAYMRYFSRAIEFLDQWIEAIQSCSNLRLLITNFDDLQDETNIVAGILDHFEVDHRMFDWDVLSQDKKKRAGHFRKGLKDEWQAVLSPDVIEWTQQLAGRNNTIDQIKMLRDRFGIALR